MYRGEDADDDNDDGDYNDDLETCFFTLSRYKLSELKKKTFSKESCLNFMSLLCK